ncbi:uncharacterized protein LOC135382993 [Ornithodoros turicata]|uniref:uncharacterized protein LOC135382993 n=1 Tax=Ornithodoros turicata TaxID=34597 RepID=UPI00313A35F6
MADATAETVANTFVASWVSRFGVPSQVTTDRGPQFESRLFKGLTDILGTTRVRTTSYHPASNGLVERLHRHLKAALVAHEDRSHWVHHLPLVVLGIRAAVKTDIGCSAADLVYGCALCLPADFFVPPSPDPSPSLYLDRLHRFFDTLRPVATRASSTRRAHVPQDLSSATHVFLRTDAVRKSLTPPYSGPHPVLGRQARTYASLSTAARTWFAVHRLNTWILPPSTHTPLIPQPGTVSLQRLVSRHQPTVPLYARSPSRNTSRGQTASSCH